MKLKVGPDRVIDFPCQHLPAVWREDRDPYLGSGNNAEMGD